MSLMPDLSLPRLQRTHGRTIIKITHIGPRRSGTSCCRRFLTKGTEIRSKHLPFIGPASRTGKPRTEPPHRNLRHQLGVPAATRRKREREVALSHRSPAGVVRPSTIATTPRQERPPITDIIVGKTDIGNSMSAFEPFSSALPPKADISGRSADVRY